MMNISRQHSQGKNRELESTDEERKYSRTFKTLGQDKI